MESNLGVIARSGSLKFKDEMGDNAGNADIDIIGQCGVGFYSAFMVSDKVTVVSRAYGSGCASKWESTGTDGYTVTDWDKGDVGTDVIMHIKPDTADERYGEYLESWKLRELIKKIFRLHPLAIIMDIERTEARETGGKRTATGSRRRVSHTVTEAQTETAWSPYGSAAKAMPPTRTA